MFNRFLVAVLLLSAVAFGQNPYGPVQGQVNTKQLNVFLQNTPQPVQGVTASASGVTGSTTYYYWVVSQFTVGPTSPSASASVNNANATLSGSNFVAVSWPSTAATTYDLLRTTSNTPPTGNCACAVATGITGTTQNDTSNTLGAYTVAAAFDPTTAVLQLENIPISANVTHLQLFANNSFVSDLSSPIAGSVAWSAITAPTGNLALAMAARTTTFTWNVGATTQSDLVLQDTTTNTGTGNILDIHSVGASTEHPIIITAQGTANGVQMSSAGSLGAIGSGAIAATSCTGCTPSVIASVDLTAQSAAITTTNLNSAPLAAGQYRVTMDAKITAPATGAATSTLGPLTLVYTDPDGVAQTITGPSFANNGGSNAGDTGNSTTTVQRLPSLLLNVQASSNITYAFAYASNAANTMQYNLHIRLEKM